MGDNSAANSLEDYREQLLDTMPQVLNLTTTFRSIKKRWQGAIATAMIEVGHMSAEVSPLFGPLIRDMGFTTTNYSDVQKQLVDAIILEMQKKTVQEISDSAKFAINILKRNLFERTADVGYLATDAVISDFLIFLQRETDNDAITQRIEAVRQRLAEYRYEYTVYNDIIILDVAGNVCVNLDLTNPVTHSTDPMLQMAQSIDLHNEYNEDKYVETFRQTDLRPGCGNVLIYAHKIEAPETFESLGTLCLCFNFEDEMDSIFRDLKQGNENMVVAILDSAGHVMCANDPSVLPTGMQVPLNTDDDFFILTQQEDKYLCNISCTDGYQGFMGLEWYGLAMINAEDAFSNIRSSQEIDGAIFSNTQNLCQSLSVIKKQSQELLSDMKLDSINGRISAAKSNASAFVEILRFIEDIGGEIDKLLSSSIENIQRTAATSLFNDVRFRAFQGNNIADRNLYERANDVCWWALTPLFRQLMSKKMSQPLSDSDKAALTANLQYINNLYTPYLRLVLADKNGKVIACSNPPEGLEERLATSGHPQGQAFVGMDLDRELVDRALKLTSSKSYCVSDFEPTPLYGGRPTYIYSTAVRDSENDNRTVGVIQIVFDSEPQFQAMLEDTLPRNEKNQISTDCFGVFVDRSKKIISSTRPDFPIGSVLPISQSLADYQTGQRSSRIVTLEGRTYAMGIQVSNGYREYKRKDGYVNEVICLIFMPV